MNGIEELGSSNLPVECLEASKDAHWYAVRTRSRHEKLVARQLEKQGIQAFLPVVTKINQWSDRRKQVEEPLFSGYAFVRLDHSSVDRVRVLQTQGVVNFVGVQGAGVADPGSRNRQHFNASSQQGFIPGTALPACGAAREGGRWRTGWAGRHFDSGKHGPQRRDLDRIDPEIAERASRRIQRGAALKFSP